MNLYRRSYISLNMPKKKAPAKKAPVKKNNQKR